MKMIFDTTFLIVCLGEEVIADKGDSKIKTLDKLD